MPASSVTRKNTYNLFSFENLEEAKEYMNLAHKAIINLLTANGNFKIVIDIQTEESDLPDNVWCERCTKLIGNTDTNSTQTKLFKLIVEEISFKATE